jgi:MFS family permease
VTLAHALGSLAVLSVAPLTPFLHEAFRLSRAQVGLLLPAVYLGGVLMSLPAGWLSDRHGVRRTLALGEALTGAMVLLAALAWGFGGLLAALLVGGFGFSVLNPSTGKAILEWFPPRRRGAAMGIKQTGLTLGGIASALALPPMAAAWGWRWALATAGGAALVSALVVGLVYRPPRGLAPVTAPPRPRLREIAPFLRRRGVVVVFACGLALSSAQSSLLGYLTLFAAETFRLAAVDAARLLALAQVGGTASRLAWGVASDRLFGGRRRPGVVVSAVIAAAAYSLFALEGGLSEPLVIPLALLAGAGAFGWVGLYFALVAEIGGARHAGLLTGVATMFAWSGVLVGPPVFGLVLDASGSYAAAWLLLAGVTLAVAAVLPLLRPLVDRG